MTKGAAFLGQSFLSNAHFQVNTANALNKWSEWCAPPPRPAAAAACICAPLCPLRLPPKPRAPATLGPHRPYFVPRRPFPNYSLDYSAWGSAPWWNSFPVMGFQWYDTFTTTIFDNITFKDYKHVAYPPSGGAWCAGGARAPRARRRQRSPPHAPAADRRR